MRRAISATMALLGALVAWPGTADAQVLSAGCQFFAAGQPLGVLPFTGQFFAGETITVTANLVPGQPAGVVQLFIGGPPPTTGNLNPENPTVTAVSALAADAVVTISLLAVPPALEITGTVTCTAAAYPLAVSSPQSAAEVSGSPAAFTSEADSGFPLGTVVLIAGAVLFHAGMGAAVLRRRRQASD